MKKFILASFTIGFLAIPLIGFAAVTNFDELVQVAGGIIGQLIILIAAAALLVFFWGLFRFIAGAGNEEKIKEGKRFMFWGIIGFFVMMSVWGIVQILYNTFFEGVDPTIPPIELDPFS